MIYGLTPGKGRSRTAVEALDMARVFGPKVLVAGAADSVSEVPRETLGCCKSMEVFNDPVLTAADAPTT